MPPPAKFPALALSLVLVSGCSSGEGTASGRGGDSALPPLEGQDLSLRTRREKSVPGKPEWIHSIDVDGDGALDVLSATNSPGAVMLWRAGRSPAEGFAVGEYPLRPTPLERGDGQPPLVAVASRADDSLVLYDLSRANEPQLKLELSLPDRPMVVTEGVLDGERGAELLVVTRRGQLLRVGVEGIEHSQQLVSSVPRCALVLGPEVGVVVGFQESDSLELYAARAGQEELEHRGSFELPGTARDLLGLDLDGDGDQELIVVGGDESGWILGLDGAPLFATEPAPRHFATTAIPIRLRPLPQWGPKAWGVLASKGVACELWEWSERGPKRFGFSIAGQTPVDMALADADGDGRADFWVANRDAHTVSLLRNDEQGPISPGKLEVGTFPNDIATGDLDGDGMHEAFVIDAKDNRITTLTREEGWLRPGARIETGPSPRAVACVDLDGDGWRDLVWLERVFAGTHLNLRLGDGEGGLHQLQGYEPLPMGIGARDFVVESFDGDPRRFLVAVDTDGRRILWTHIWREGATLKSDQHGELSLPKPPRAITSIYHKGAPRGIAVAMQISVDKSLVQIYAPQVEPQAGLSWLKLGETTISGAVTDIESGDFDGDGTEDIVVLAADREGSVGGRVAPLLLRGGKPYLVGLLKTGLRSMRVIAEDLDGDGLAEIVVANLDSHNVNAWLAVPRGKGVGFRSLDDIGAGVGCIALASPDLDGDGDLDLLIVDSANDGVSVIYNETN